MRVGKVDWVMHSNMPILSVDAQPNGYRFVTGGTDHKVCIWNLLPVISEQYEKMGVKRKNAQEENKQKTPQTSNANKNAADIEMKNQDNGSKASNEDEEEESYDYDAQDGYKDDIKIMESLFESDQKRSQRLLAILDSHSNPVNCVRWNNIGTLFASAADDGSVLLWEYVGEMVATAFQKFQVQSSSNSRSEKKAAFFEGSKQFGSSSAFENQAEEDDEQNNQQIFEEWRNKRAWRGHKGGVSDLAWSPDNIHFASCGTDSQIIIWSINEQSAIKHIDQKANGLTFDPFGKFMASQSSEDKALIVWRIQDFKNLTKECEHHSYYKHSMSQSLFRRLSWSADGQFISTTAGRVGPHHIAPLIERSSWNQLAALSGHNKTITTSRINPKLYKDPNGNKEFDMATGEYREALSCYSVVALASIDSTISIWKPYLSKPFAVVLDIFKMGITDLSWGFNGDVLLASSNDGKIFSMHFKPGVLGNPITELEKQLIIEKKYGATILNDYKKHTKLLQGQNNLYSAGGSQLAGSTHNASIASQSLNLTANQLKEQQKEVVKQNGKKKIVPVMVKQYNESANINPFINPFQNQMLIDQSIINSSSNSSNVNVTNTTINVSNRGQQEEMKMENITYQEKPAIQKQQQQQQQQLQQQQAASTKLPSFNQAFGNSSENHLSNPQQTIISTTQGKSQIIVTSSPVLSYQKESSQQQQQQQIPVGSKNQSVAQQQSTDQQQQQLDEVNTIEGKNNKELLEMSGKKTKKTKRKKQDQDSAAASITGIPSSSTASAIQQTSQQQIQQQQILLQQQQQQLLGTNQQIRQMAFQQNSLLNQSSFYASKEQLQQLERILDMNKDTVTVITIEDFQSLCSIKDKDQIQINLPARDAFSEEIRVFITNVDFNAFNRRADIKIYNSENIEVSHSSIEREFVILTTVCGAFFVLYTNMGQLLIYSTRTTQLVKNGLIIEGLCFLDSSEDSMSFVAVTLKGTISVYKIKNPDYPSVDSCTLQWQASITDVLKIKSQQAQVHDASAKNVYIKYVKIVRDGGVMIFLTDGSVVEYDLPMKLWRSVGGTGAAGADPSGGLNPQGIIDIGRLQSQEEQKQNHRWNFLNKEEDKTRNISQIIKLLETQSIEDRKLQQLQQVPNFQQQQVLDQEMLTLSQQQQQQYQELQRNPYSLETQLQKISQMQESLQIYERLMMKNEFLYTLRMYTSLVISVGDFFKLKDLMFDYRFLTTWEEEQALSNVTGGNQKQYTLHGQQIKIESAYNNLCTLLLDEDEEGSALVAGGNTNTSGGMNDKVKVIRVDDKKYFKICGMEKKEVFQYAILPVIKTLAQTSNEVKDVLAQIIKVISEHNQPTQQSKQSQAMMRQNLILNGGSQPANGTGEELMIDQEMVNAATAQQQQVYQVISAGGQQQQQQQQQYSLLLPSIQNLFPQFIVDPANADLQQLEQQMVIAANQNPWPFMQLQGDQIIASSSNQNNAQQTNANGQQNVVGQGRVVGVQGQGNAKKEHLQFK